MVRYPSLFFARGSRAFQSSHSQASQQLGRDALPATTPSDFCGSGRDQLQMRRPVFLPCELQRVLRVSDKLCDTVNEIELLEFRECGKSIKHVV